MDIQSFILGVGVMLVIALVIGSVIALVKVLKISKDFNSTQMWVAQEFERTRKEIDRREVEVYHRIEETERAIESRSDKLYDKIMKEVNPNKKFLDTVTRYPRSSAVLSKELQDAEDDVPEETSAQRVKRIMDKMDTISPISK